MDVTTSTSTILPDPRWAVATCLVAIAVLVVAEQRKSQRLKWIAKPLASASFVATAILRGALVSDHGTYGTVIVIALLLGLLGDVLLIPKSKGAFLGGIVAFLLGHLGFCVGFWVKGVDLRVVGGAAVLLALVGFWVGRWLMPSVPPKLKGAVVAYIAVISTMLALAIGAAANGAVILLGAALLFYASDLSVAMDRFKHAGFWNRAWGVPAYFIAQLLFAWFV